jgi:hypothetical protein
MQKTTRVLSLLAATATLAGCSADSTIPVDTGNSGGYVRVINASRVPFDVYLDGAMRRTGLGVADAADLSVSLGAHTVRVLAAGGAELTYASQVTTGGVATFAIDGGAGSPLASHAIADTGSVVPANKSKLRVTHLAGGAQSIEIWRTQPDYQTPIHIMTPFNYGNTSPYLQSDPGTWEVFVTAAGSTAKLATTGPVSIPAGERRTIAVLDSAGVLKLRVLPE